MRLMGAAFVTMAAPYYDNSDLKLDTFFWEKLLDGSCRSSRLQLRLLAGMRRKAAIVDILLIGINRPKPNCRASTKLTCPS